MASAALYFNIIFWCDGSPRERPCVKFRRSARVEARSVLLLGEKHAGRIPRREYRGGDCSFPDETLETTFGIVNARSTDHRVMSIRRIQSVEERGKSSDRSCPLENALESVFEQCEAACTVFDPARARD